MYFQVTPSPTRTSASRRTRSIIVPLSSFCCVGTFLLLSASTIVLALIPLYQPNTAQPASVGATTSKLVTMRVQIQSAAAGRRRRQSTTNYDTLIDGELDGNSEAAVGQQILARLPMNLVHTVIMSATRIEYGDTRRRRRGRFSLEKRATTREIDMEIDFYLGFAAACALLCQKNNAGTLKQKLQTITDNGQISVGKVNVVKNGQLIGAIDNLVVNAVRAVSAIIPGNSPVTVTSTSTTISSTTSTTTQTSTTTTTAMLTVNLG